MPIVGCRCGSGRDIAYSKLSACRRLQIGYNPPMHRRHFLRLGLVSCGLPTLPLQSEKSKLKIAGVRLVCTRAKRPVPAYTPASGSWSTGGVEVASPMSIYAEYKAQRSLFMPEPDKLPGFTVEISTDNRVKGYGMGGMGGGVIAEEHFTKLLLGKDPFDVERIWDILWRSSMYYGRGGDRDVCHQRRGCGPLGSHRQRSGNARIRTARRRDHLRRNRRPPSQTWRPF